MTLEQKVLEQLFMDYIETTEYENDPLTQQAEKVYHEVMEEVKQWFEGADRQCGGRYVHR